MLTRTNDLFERWHHFKKWECVNNGMWKSQRNDMNKVQECARLLADPVECLKAMEMAVDKYPISAEQHLSKQGNRNPWIGQSACCVWFGATEEETRIAWNFYMTKEEQDSANNIAKLVIANWEAKNA